VIVTMRKNNLDAARVKLQPLAVLQGVALAFGLLLLIALALALAVFFTTWQATPRLLNLLAHLAVVAGAFWAGKRCLRWAWLHGVVVGLAAFLLFGLLSSARQPLLSWLWWQRMLRMVLAAMFGGMLGGLGRKV
jgi:putative membrane protein (TIGR04086 family)